MREYKSGKSPRTTALPERWWDKRPKPVDNGMRTLERLIGPAAYRGAHRRTLSGDRRRSGQQKDRRYIMDTQPGQKGIPTHGNPAEGLARRPTARPEQVERIQNISRKTKPSIRGNMGDEDDFQDFS